MTGLPDGLQLGKMVVRALEKPGKGIKRLQFFFMGTIKIRGHKHRILDIGDFIIHQAMEVGEPLGSKFGLGGVEYAFPPHLLYFPSFSKE